MPSLSTFKTFLLKPLEFLSKWFLRLALAVLIILALYISLARYYLPRLNDYKPDIEKSLSYINKAPVVIGSLSGHLQGLNPVFQIKDLTIGSGDKKALSIKSVTAAPNLFNSVWNRAARIQVLDIQAAELRLYEQHDKTWGFLKSLNKDNKKDIDWSKYLLAFERLKLHKVIVHFDYLNGTKQSTPALTALLEASGDFRRLQLLLDGELDELGLPVKDTAPSAYFMSEGLGNPLHESYEGQWEFKVSDSIDISFLSALFISLDKKVDAELTKTHMLGKVLAGKKYQTQAKVKFKKLTIAEPNKKIIELEDVAFQAKWERDGLATLGQDKIWVQQLMLRQFGIDHQIVDQMVVDHAANKHVHQYKVSIGAAQLKPVSRLLSTLAVLPSSTRQFLVKLQAVGELKNVQFFVQKNKHKTKQAAYHWQFSSNVKKARIKPFKGIPAVNNANAYVWANLNNGFVDVDQNNALQIQFADIYDQFLSLKKVKAKLFWQRSKTGTYIYSEPIQAKLKGGDVDGWFAIDLSLDKKSPAVLALNLGLKNTPLSIHKVLVPKILSKSLISWLNSALSVGQVNQAALLFHSPVGNKNKKRSSNLDRIVQLDIDFDNTSLNYDKQWPQVNNLAGQLRLNNNDVVVNVDKGSSLKTQLKQAVVDIKPSKQGMLLNLNASLQGAASDALYILNETSLPTKNGIFNTWTANGDVATQLQLALPLAKGATVSPTVDIKATLNNVDLKLAEQQLAFENIKGPLHYSSEKGVSSTGVKAELFNKPLAAKMTSDVCVKNNTTPCIKIQANGVATAADLERWTGQKILSKLQGSANYTAALNIKPDSSIDIKAQSNLKGISIDVPKPLFKASSEARALTYVHNIKGDASDIDVRIGDEFRFLTRSKRGVSVGQRVSFSDQGRVDLKPLLAGQLSVDGSLGPVKAEEWLAFYTKNKHLLVDDSVPQGASKIIFDNLLLSKLEFAQYHINNATVSVDSFLDNTSLAVSSEFIKGVASYQHSAELADLKLDYIDLAKITKQDKVIFSPDNVDPQQVPGFDFYVNDLRDGKKTYGTWSFRSRAKKIGEKSVLFADQIKGKLQHVEVTSSDGQGATLIWNKQKGSSFQGRLISDNPAKVLVALGYEPMLDAKQVQFDTDVRWPGNPLQFSLVESSGDWSMSFKNGSFLQAQSTATNTLKLLGFLNVAKILRRLRLDFSDLAAQGLAFDSVSGAFSNRRGVFQTTQPVVIKGTSSEIKINGNVNAKLQTVDVGLAVTIPIGSNLPWVAVLAAGLPAAAGIFIASKLMRKTVDQLSSLVYQVKGDWNNPDIKFKHIFDVGKQVDILSAAVDQQSRPKKVKIEGLLNCGKDVENAKLSANIGDKEPCA